MQEVWAKVERADEHIENLATEMEDLISGDTYHLLIKLNDDATECALIAIGSEPPLRVSTIIGDIAHQLRSCLDLLVSCLVTNNGGTPSKRHQYPICDTPEAFRRALKKGPLTGISTPAKNFIEATQPYKNSEGIDINFLHALRELNNADKHRSLINANAMVNTNELKLELDKDVTLAGLSPPRGPQRPTRKGVELYTLTFGEPQPGIKIQGNLVVEIVFNESGVLPGEPVFLAVRQLSNRTARLIKHFEDTEFN